MTFAEQYKTDLTKALAGIDSEKVQQAIEVLKEARENDRQIFVFGNGGSASTASHFACDMVKGASWNRAKRSGSEAR